MALFFFTLLHVQISIEGFRLLSSSFFDMAFFLFQFFFFFFSFFISFLIFLYKLFSIFFLCLLLFFPPFIYYSACFSVSFFTVIRFSYFLFFHFFKFPFRLYSHSLTVNAYQYLNIYVFSFIPYIIFLLVFFVPDFFLVCRQSWLCKFSVFVDISKVCLLRYLVITVLLTIF